MCYLCGRTIRSRLCILCGIVSDPAPSWRHMKTWACAACAPDSPWNIEHNPNLASKTINVGILKRSVATAALDISDLQTKKYTHSQHYPQYPLNGITEDEEERMWFGI